MKLIMENWRNYNVNMGNEFNLINEINTMAYTTYGIQPSEFMNYQEQAYVINELSFNTCNQDAMNAMIVCGLLKNNNGEETILNEQIMQALSFLRAGWNSVKFIEVLNTMVGYVADKLGVMKYNEAIKDLKADIAQKCAEEFDIDVDSKWHVEAPSGDTLGPYNNDVMIKLVSAGKIVPEQRVIAVGQKDWQPASTMFLPYQKCVLFKPPVPPEIEELQNSSTEKVSGTIKGIFDKIKKSFHKLIAYIAAVAIYRTFKPSEKQKIQAAPVAETILLFISTGVSGYIIGAGLIFGSPWWQMIMGGIFLGLEGFSAYKKLEKISKMPRTGEEAEEALKQQQKAAADLVIEEIEAKQAAAA